MIPKKIHYCWFGRNPIPKAAQKCIASWKKYCPDYEIIEWNEDNFDVNLNGYTKMCYEQKKYAFLTDYVRLLVIEKEGGIYFDTDVEVIRSFDDFLNYDAFFGFETEKYIASGLGFGAVSGHPIMAAMIAQYDQLLDGEHGTIGCPILNTAPMEKFGFVLDGTRQEKGGILLCPQDVLNPFDSATGTLHKTGNTHSIHWYSMSWLSDKKRARTKVTRVFHRIFGVNCFKWLKK